MTDKSTQPPPIDESAIAEQAARWHTVIAKAGRRELAQFNAWLKMSPRHGYHFMYARALDVLLKKLDPDRTKFDPRAWVQEARSNVIPLPTAPIARTEGMSEESERASETATGAPTAPPLPKRAENNRRSFLREAIAASAAVVLLAVGWITASDGWGWKEFKTGTGEQRSVELADGSIVHLNTDSRVLVRLTDHVRDIRLAQGEALFTVHHDTTRPFRVHAPGSVIQAVGTQFNVYRRDNATRVSVIEGVVRITSDSEAKSATKPTAAESPQQPKQPEAPTLTAGQEAEITTAGRISRRPQLDVVNVVAWRQRRLVFHADSLADMVAEFNRYNLSPKFRLEGVDGYNRHYTGTFDANDPESLAVVLAQEGAYSVERVNGDIIIRPPSAGRGAVFGQ